MAMGVDGLTMEIQETSMVSPCPSDESIDTTTQDAADPLPASTTPDSFRFKDLPAELQNEVFDHALLDTIAIKNPKPKEKKQLPATTEIDLIEFVNAAASTIMPFAAAPISRPITPAQRISASISKAADVNILSVDKETRNAYAARARNFMTLEFRDHEEFHFTPFDVPVELKAAHFVVFQLLFFCHTCRSVTHVDELTCHAAAELACHVKMWMKGVLSQMMSLWKVSVYGHISHDTFKVAGKVKAPCEQIVKERFKDLQSLGKISHLVLYRHDHDPSKNLQGAKEIVYEWEDGVEYEVKEVPKPVEKKKGDDKDADAEDESEKSTMETEEEDA